MNIQIITTNSHSGPSCSRQTELAQRIWQYHQIFVILLQEALDISNTSSLVKYLQAVEELKQTVPDGAKLQLEEQSRDASAKWEVRASGPWACGFLWSCAWSSSEPLQASSVSSVIRLR